MPTPGEELDPDEGEVLALDNIALELPLAGFGSRVLAGALDYLLLVVGGTVLVVALAIGLGAAGVSGWVVLAVVILLGFALHWGYFVAFEIGSRGRTPGKMAVGLRVVGREGGTPAVSALVVRNLLRAIDVVAGIPIMAADPQSRRLGDRLAGTVVVHDRAPRAEATLGRIPPGWGPREVALAESYLRRRAEMNAGRSRYLARRLLRLVAQSAPDYLAEAAGVEDPDLALRRALRVEER